MIVLYYSNPWWAVTIFCMGKIELSKYRIMIFWLYRKWVLNWSFQRICNFLFLFLQLFLSLSSSPIGQHAKGLAMLLVFICDTWGEEGQLHFENLHFSFSSHQLLIYCTEIICNVKIKLLVDIHLRYLCNLCMKIQQKQSAPIYF